MEPEDRELIEKIMNQYKWPREYSVVDARECITDIETTTGQSYKVMTSGATSYRHMDLSSVSTRDLLNECYRRRAIEKFSYTTSVDIDFLQMHQSPYEYVLKDAGRNLWGQVMKTKFFDDAMVVNEERDNMNRRYNLACEVYVCKHPSKVKK